MTGSYCFIAFIYTMYVHSYDFNKDILLPSICDFRLTPSQYQPSLTRSVMCPSEPAVKVPEAELVQTIISSDTFCLKSYFSVQNRIKNILFVINV